MGNTFKDAYKSEKERIKKDLAFRKFKKEMHKMDKLINQFNQKYL